jgi:hypothetical protein
VAILSPPSSALKWLFQGVRACVCACVRACVCVCVCVCIAGNYFHCTLLMEKQGQGQGQAKEGWGLRPRAVKGGFSQHSRHSMTHEGLHLKLVCWPTLTRLYLSQWALFPETLSGLERMNQLNLAMIRP